MLIIQSQIPAAADDLVLILVGLKLGSLKAGLIYLKLFGDTKS